MTASDGSRTQNHDNYVEYITDRNPHYETHTSLISHIFDPGGN